MISLDEIQSDILSIGENALRKALTKKAQTIEVFLLRKKTISVVILNDKVDRCELINDEGGAIRLVKSRSLGFSSFSPLTEKALTSAIDRAFSLTQLNSRSPRAIALPAPKSFPSTTDCFDERVDESGVEQFIHFSKRLLDAVKSVRHDISVSGSLLISTFKYGVVNSEGVCVSDKGTIFVLNCYTNIRKAGREEGLYFERSEGRMLKSLKPEELGQRCAEKTVDFLNPRTVKTQKLPVILLSQFLARIFLHMFGYGANATLVSKRQSFLYSRINEQIGADNLTITDDGLLPNGIGTSCCDAEGVPSQKTAIIKGGFLKSYLRDVSESDTKFCSTGNCSRGGHSINHRSFPSIWYRNILIGKGDRTLAEFIEETDKGLLCLTTLDSPNTVSGEFYGRIENAFMIERGKISYPVRGAMIKINLLKMLKNNDGMGNENETVYGITTPPLKFNEIVIVGD
jgi:PmbA protein